MSPRSHDAQTGTDDDWPVQLLQRTGSPPLRVIAREVVRHQSGEDVVVLWTLRSGGYAVSLDRAGPDGRIRFAKKAKSLDRAMADLEEACARPFAGDPPSGDDAAGWLARARLGNAAQNFAALAGEALSAWDTWAAAGAALTARKGDHGR